MTGFIVFVCVNFINTCNIQEIFLLANGTPVDVFRRMAKST